MCAALAAESSNTGDRPAESEHPLIAALGLQESGQLPLYLPVSYMDCTYCDRSAATLDRTRKSVIRLKVSGTPAFNGRSGPPRLTLPVIDSGGGAYRATIFGDTRQWQERLRVGQSTLYLATGHEFGGRFCVVIHGEVPDAYAGRLVPVYDVPRGRLTQEVVRSFIARQLGTQLPSAVAGVRNAIEVVAPVPDVLRSLGAEQWSLAKLIRYAHYPEDLGTAADVLLTLKRIAALAALGSAAPADVSANPLRLPSLPDRIGAMPFALTEDQQKAVGDIVTDLTSPARTAHRIIAGDCGVGKTAVAGVVCAAAADSGYRCVVLFPSTILAAQAHAEFQAWYPDITITLITGDTGPAESLAAPIIMGTTALLHRELGSVDLLIVDEQHRFGVGQRGHHHSSRTHLVELSATCIPRTLALVRCGQADVTEMRQTHKPKFIETKLAIGRPEAREVMDEVTYAVRSGSPLFVIYPKREKGDDPDDRINIEAGAKLWEALFPGQVCTLTSQDDDTAKNAAISSIASGQKRILLATTVVEVGVDVKSLRHILILNPHRYGLTQLHQLRGRVARSGGEGWCYLVAPDGMPATSRERLDVFLKTTDGFELAEADLAQRGSGDLSAMATRQHGADGNLLNGVKMEVEVYEEVAPLVRYFCQRRSVGTAHLKG